jgi:hypothetical protein
MNSRTWIVICGQVRNLFELAYSLHIAVAARRRGVVEGVILSTWLGEREKAAKLFSAAENDGVYIVESASPAAWKEQPRDRTGPLYQMLAIHRALEIIPDDSYVLKTRTDLVPDCALHFLNILERPDQWIGRDALLNKERIAVLYANNALFFDICDTQFFGHRAKLLDLFEFGVFADAMTAPYPWHFVSETRIFGQKYLRGSRYLSFLSSIIDMMKFIEVPAFSLATDSAVLPQILLGAYATYYAALLRDFQLVFQGAAVEGRFRLRDLFTPHGRFCEEPYRPGCALIRLDAKLRSLAGAAPDRQDRNASRFLALLEARRGASADESADRFGTKDVEELIAFNTALPEERRFLSLPDEAIRARVPRPKQHRREFDLREALALPDGEFSSVFVQKMEQGATIEAAAYQTFEAVAQRGAAEQEAAQFWLELAAHYGNGPAQDATQMPRRDFGEARQQREAWLNQRFPKT